jgi:pimeloyl-ACP methyl ester carboxylesterase
MLCRVRDVEFYYEEAGSGRPLLALHGWPLDHRHMQAALEPLFAGRPGWRRIYPDLPGMGRTRAPDWIASQGQVVELIEELIEALLPGQRFALAGTSYGGWLVRALVHDMGARLDGVAAIVPAMYGTSDSPALGRSSPSLPRHRVRRADPAFVAALEPGEEGALDMVVSQDVAVIERWRRAILPAGAVADTAFLERLRVAGYELGFDPDALAQPFDRPALILTGRFDDVCGYRRAYDLLDAYPCATFAVLDGAGHSLPEEQPALFAALVGDWLDRVAAAG